MRVRPLIIGSVILCAAPLVAVVMAQSGQAGTGQSSTAQTPPAQASAAGGRGQGRGPALPPVDPPATFFSKNTPKDLVEFDMMTWPEVYRAIHQEGKTTALFYTGGTESRGPQNVNGGHTIMAKATAREIALTLGNAIVMPVLPYTPNNASAQAPGTLSLTPEILSIVLERLSEDAITTGFKNIILMGDHGGGQPAAYAAVAKKLEDKYAAKAATDGKPQDVHVYFCDEVYKKAQDDFDTYLADHNLPVSSHAGIPDTSTMMYLQQRDGRGQDYTRLDLLPVAVTVGGVAARGQRPPVDPNPPRVAPSGVSGDGRASTTELGKMAMQVKIDYAVRQIRQFIADQKK